MLTLDVRVNSADLSIIFPSLYAYMHELEHSYLFYGLLAAAFNMGQMVSTLFMGPFADNRSIKEVLLFSTACSFAGNLLYLLHGENDILLIVGRAIAGFGAGTVFVAYAHITRVSKRGPERYVSIPSINRACVMSMLSYCV